MHAQVRRSGSPGTPQPMSPELEGWARVPAERGVGGFACLRTEMDWPYTGLFDPIPCLIQSSSDFVPPVDLYGTDTEVVLNVRMPGMSPADFLVEVTGHTLFLSGVREPTVREPATRVQRAEGDGRFHLRVHLPVEVDSGRVQATYRNEILQVRMPTVEAILLRPIKIPIAR